MYYIPVGHVTNILTLYYLNVLCSTSVNLNYVYQVETFGGGA